MKRRDFLRFGVSVPAALATRGVHGQANTITRAAIVIGIDQPENLPPLRAAVSGANKVGEWLESEGFEVKRFTDEAKSVKAEEVFDAINGLVKLGTLKQLVVYFAGHGCIVGTGEFWLLTKALQNPNEAVSVNVCLDRSRLCGIPNVVLISDACRSTSASLGIQELNGYVIFPTTNNRNVFTYLDRFLAVRTGAPAYEVKDTANEYQGIYTSCILDAYLDPDDSMIEEINDVSVVTNKKLEDYLLSEVPKRAQISNALQYPDSSVTSTNSYIGRAKIRGPFPSGGRGCRGCRGCAGCAVDFPSARSKPKVGSIPPTINDLSEFELGRLGIDIRTTASKKSSATDLQKTAQDTGFAAIRDSILNARGPNVFKYGTGINLFGARLQTAFSVNMEAQILRQGDGSREPAVVQINPQGKLQDGVALEFEDGSGTVIAALQRYVATVFVAGGGIVNVSYAPAQIGDELRTSRSNNRRADELQALIATSTKFGVFRIDGPPEISRSNAKQLANAIRVRKPVDPTLALYAAYAYADAGLSEQIRSLHEIVRDQLGIDLFDIAMLSGALSNGKPVEAQVPFYPMLSQGWQFLRARNVILTSQIAKAQSYILPAPWTTFDREGMSIVKSALDFRNLR